MINTIHQRLIEWADWVKLPNGVQLGYPNADLVARSVFGGVKTGDGDDGDAMEIEGIVNKAPHQLRRIADYKYVKNYNHEFIAKREKISKSHVKNLVNFLQAYVQGALDQRDG